MPLENWELPLNSGCFKLPRTTNCPSKVPVKAFLTRSSSPQASTITPLLPSTPPPPLLMGRKPFILRKPFLPTLPSNASTNRALSWTLTVTPSDERGRLSQGHDIDALLTCATPLKLGFDTVPLTCIAISAEPICQLTWGSKALRSNIPLSFTATSTSIFSLSFGPKLGCWFSPSSRCWGDRLYSNGVLPMSFTWPGPPAGCKLMLNVKRWSLVIAAFASALANFLFLRAPSSTWKFTFPCGASALPPSAAFTYKFPLIKSSP
mmetsp:Transcript_1120/g.3279  ORF Transcript_1120/g.3279 Transcript_1120/m.3279 type:complete len:263 (+) Transcript_1120:1118-1906(+)